MTQFQQKRQLIPSLRLERRFTLWRHVQRSRKQIRTTIQTGRTPLIVYSHPKTASRAIELAVSRVPLFCPFHTHVLQVNHFTWQDFRNSPLNDRGIAPDSQPEQWAIRKEIIDKKVPLKLVSLVRDPVAVSVSWFFFGLQRWLGYQNKLDPAKLDFEELCSFFFNIFNHDGMLHWFEDEWNKTVGLNIFDSKFDKERGFSSYKNGEISALVLSTHVDDTNKIVALSEFLEQEVPSVSKENTSESRVSPEVYLKLKEAMIEQEELVNRLLSSDYSRFFFSNEMLNSFREQWS